VQILGHITALHGHHHVLLCFVQRTDAPRRPPNIIPRKHSFYISKEIFYVIGKTKETFCAKEIIQEVILLCQRRL